VRLRLCDVIYESRGDGRLMIRLKFAYGLGGRWRWREGRGPRLRWFHLKAGSEIRRRYQWQELEGTDCGAST